MIPVLNCQRIFSLSLSLIPFVPLIRNAEGRKKRRQFFFLLLNFSYLLSRQIGGAPFQRGWEEDGGEKIHVSSKFLPFIFYDKALFLEREKEKKGGF